MLRTIHHVPREILSEVFSHVETETVAIASSTCQLWRNVACKDPLMWREIIVRTMSLSSIEFMGAQLRRARDRPVKLFINFPEEHVLVSKGLIPLIKRAIPITQLLYINIEAIYRLEFEMALFQPAPYLKQLRMTFHHEPEPELAIHLPFAAEGRGLNLFRGYDESAAIPPHLEQVWMRNVILPLRTIPSFANVLDVNFIHALSTFQDDFPCYLFDFFPRMTRLRLAGGECRFHNVPFAEEFILRFRQLRTLDLAYKLQSLPLFFEHLPIHSIPELFIAGADEDAVYSAVTPLLSPFKLSIKHYDSRRTEFLITLTGSDPAIVRHFTEDYCCYEPEAPPTQRLVLLENDLAAEQLEELILCTSLWKMMVPWLEICASAVPNMTLVIDDDTLNTTRLPPEPLCFPKLQKLTIQTDSNGMHGVFSRLHAQEILYFADRLCSDVIELELCSIVVEDLDKLYQGRFGSVTIKNPW